MCNVLCICLYSRLSKMTWHHNDGVDINTVQIWPWVWMLLWMNVFEICHSLSSKATCWHWRGHRLLRVALSEISDLGPKWSFATDIQRILTLARIRCFATFSFGRTGGGGGGATPLAFPIRSVVELSGKDQQIALAYDYDAIRLSQKTGCTPTGIFWRMIFLNPILSIGGQREV